MASRIVGFQLNLIRCPGYDSNLPYKEALRKFAIVVDFFADLCCPLFFRGVQKGLFFRSFLTCWRPLLEGVSP